MAIGIHAENVSLKRRISKYVTVTSRVTLGRQKAGHVFDEGHAAAWQNEKPRSIHELYRDYGHTLAELNPGAALVEWHQ